jgi:hypothetical protein
MSLVQSTPPILVVICYLLRSSRFALARPSVTPISGAITLIYTHHRTRLARAASL